MRGIYITVFNVFDPPSKKGILKKEGMRDKVKVLIGGLSTSKEFNSQRKIGTDGWGRNAIEGIGVAKRLLDISKN